MLRLIGLVVSIGLADSLNPTTIGPALFLAGGERPRKRVAEFTLAVFVVYLVGGAVIALGPGQLLLSLLPKPDAEDRNVLQLVVGGAMIAGATVLWRHRAKLADKEPPANVREGTSSVLLGATITAVELPTAFPYFAAIAAIVGSGLNPVRQLVLLLIFNICFILPLLGIVGTLSLPGDRAVSLLATGRDFLQRRWPVVLATLALAAGVFIMLLGATGFASRTHGHFGRLARHLRHIITP
ncbi:MAG: GAP family protein [Solirubrobacteraceae bacterium]